MPYITREDGERFVIPSYRDVLSAKQKSVLKRDILTLSQSYGEYITLQRKNPTQYEVTFSTDTGYLLGESIWQFFKKPLDMIYCEAIPNTSEAILVIVKSGSVYLDGRFPVETIPEELVIFLTQQNNFEIYVYGDVPISQEPQEGKFAFETSSIKSFTVLEQPIFPTLPLYKIYQLQLVDQVLKAQGIGVFPTKQLVLALFVIGLGWLAWSYFSQPAPEVVEAPPEINPFQNYNTLLMSPAPDEVIHQIVNKINVMFTMPGWIPLRFDYIAGSLSVAVRSEGGLTQDLFKWAEEHEAGVSIKPEGMFVNLAIKTTNRPLPKQIYPITQVIGRFVDNLSYVYQGNRLQLSDVASKGVYSQVNVRLAVNNVTPSVLDLIGKQFQGLPFVLQNVSLTIDTGILSGTITFEALGS